MRLDLTGRHLDITPVVRRLVAGKVARLDRMMQNSALSAQVVLSREKNGYRADVTVHARGEKFLHGIGVADALQGCLGGAFDKIGQQAQTMKGKLQERKRHGPAKGEAVTAAEPVKPSSRRNALARSAADVVARPRMPRIIRTSRQPLKSMTVGDAARQMDGEEGVMVFRDADTSEVSVLYRAASGELTLVETEG
jgi:putative sigma-54 modulation protein